jgi:hypothetical protein
MLVYNYLPCSLYILVCLLLIQLCLILRIQGWAWQIAYWQVGITEYVCRVEFAVNVWHWISNKVVYWSVQKHVFTVECYYHRSSTSILMWVQWRPCQRMSHKIKKYVVSHVFSAGLKDTRPMRTVSTPENVERVRPVLVQSLVILPQDVHYYWILQV